MVETHKVLRRVGVKPNGGTYLKFQHEPVPTHGPSDVLIRVRAVSLNWKDAAIIDGRFPFACFEDGIVGTEFAGEVEAVGEKVRLFKAGDRVVSLINFNDITGRETATYAFGHDMDGPLAEYIVCPENVLVIIPEHLTFAEASTIPCAGVTAWNALNMKSRLFGKTVLIQGTGGVSLIALILAAKAGALVIVTSSSDEKLEKAKDLGAWKTINYIKTPAWEEDVLKLTSGEGVDIVIEQGGAATLLKSIITLRRNGQVSQVGFLTNNSDGDFATLVQLLIYKTCSIVGTRVGIKADLEEFMEFSRLTGFHLTSCIDRIFKFDQAMEALDYLRSGNAFGKVVVEL